MSVLLRLVQGLVKPLEQGIALDLMDVRIVCMPLSFPWQQK